MKTDNDKSTKYFSIKRLLNIYGIPAIVTFLYGVMAFLPDLRSVIPEIIVLSSIIFCLSALFVFKIRGDEEPYRLSLVILAVAVVIRYLFLFRPPELSDDLYRYLWDGMNLRSGINPYAYSPSDAASVNEEARHILSNVNHPHLVTIYPPAAQLVFWISSLLDKGILGIKSLLTLLDIISCLLLLKISKRFEIPLKNCVLYAWNPLSVIEISGSGHIDGAAVFFFLAAVYLLPQTWGKGGLPECLKSLWPGVLMGFSFLVKLLPAIYLPGLVMASGKKRGFILCVGFAVSSFILITLFTPEIKNSLLTLDIYLKQWEFSGFFFRILREITHSGEIARKILLTFFLSVAAYIYISLFVSLKRGVNTKRSHGPKGVPVTQAEEIMFLFKSFYWLIFSFLLFTPTLHPWYALYLAVVLPFHPEVSGIIFTFSVLLSYKVLIPYYYLGEWVEDDITAAFVCLPPLIAAISTPILLKILKKRRKSSALFDGFL